MTPAPAAGPDAPIELDAGPMRLALRPDLGGCVAGLWHGDLPVLVSADPAALVSAWPSGCFVLAPYSNRLGGSQFEWLGQRYSVARNNSRSVHAMHGAAWAAAWQVRSASRNQAELEYLHRPDAHWPFAFSLRQHFSLSSGGLRMQLQLRSTDARSQPAGLGWHPYFPKRLQSHLTAAVTGRWQPEPGGELPTHRRAQDGLDADVAALDVDHCYDGWAGVAQLRDECLAITLRSSLPCLVVYTPPERAFFCVEPVSHVNNALNLDDPAALGVHALAPGQALTADFSLDVVPIRPHTTP